MMWDSGPACPRQHGSLSLCIYYLIYAALLFCKLKHLFWLLETENLIKPSCGSGEVQAQSPLDRSIHSVCTSQLTLNINSPNPGEALYSPLDILYLSLDGLTPDTHH